jgi:hypothetical protein
MNSAVFCLHYLPNIEWYCNFIRYEKVYLERHENFEKSSYRNRCEILGANGPLTLSVPILGGRDHHRSYTATEIFYNNNWQRIHWNSIMSAYGKTPFFEYYAPLFNKHYCERKTLLFDLNMGLLLEINTILKLKIAVELTETYQKDITESIDQRILQPIELSRYYQAFENKHGFVSNLSILDLIFHEGPNATRYLLQQKSPA